MQQRIADAKATDIEKTIVVKEHERARYDFDPTMFYENRFWNQRPDGIVINKYHRTQYILEIILDLPFGFPIKNIISHGHLTEILIF